MKKSRRDGQVLTVSLNEIKICQFTSCFNFRDLICLSSSFMRFGVMRWDGGIRGFQRGGGFRGATNTGPWGLLSGWENMG